MNPSPNRSASSGGITALWIAAVGGLFAGLLYCGIHFDTVPLGVATFLFFGIPVLEAVALVWGLRGGKGAWQGRLAALLALLILGGWGWAFYQFLNRPLIRLF